jgi:membrane-associated protein
MLIGFFFPGDTLLIAAGVFAANGQLSLAGIILVASLAAILGDNTGYHIGRLAGKRLLHKKDGVIFKREYIERAEKFFARFGAKAFLIAHFVPIVRTFLPVVAGVSKMDHVKFSIFDAIGDIAWAATVTLLGYFVGSKIPNLDRYILIVLGGVIVISLAPILIRLVKNYLHKNH